ncbi:L,D-transpeptidase [Jatrophihabitans fulvus]
MPQDPRPTITRRALLGGAGGLGLAAALAACTSGGRTTRSASPVAAAPSASAPSTSDSAATDSAATSPAGTPSDPPSTTRRPQPPSPVRVTTPIADGTVLGVGMPIVLSFDPTPTDASAFVEAAKVTVNGKPVDGAWFWSHNLSGQPVQAHYRTREFWPANSTVKLDLPIGGLSAGKGLVYRDELSSVTFRTGDKRVTRVDGRTLRATVEVNDRVVRTMLVSLGAPATPTFNGIKVVMQKGETDPATGRLRPDGAVSMSDDAGTYRNHIVPWAVRVTTSGEYLHAASWNNRLGQVSSSNGCTNLSTQDGHWFYDFARLGDVVVYRNCDGGELQSWNGIADWNTPWGTWTRGGLLAP